MAFFESWSNPDHIPVLPGYTERVELNAGLKLFVRAHLRLGMNQRNRGSFDRPKSACSRFRGDAELGCLSSHTKRPRARSLRCASEFRFPVEQVHGPRVARGAPSSGRGWSQEGSGVRGNALAEEKLQKGAEGPKRRFFGR